MEFSQQLGKEECEDSLDLKAGIPEKMGGESDNLSFWTRRSAAWQLSSGYPQDKGGAKKSKRVVIKHPESEGTGSKACSCLP